MKTFSKIDLKRQEAWGAASLICGMALMCVARVEAELVDANPHVQPDAVTAFKGLSHHGEALGFRMGAGAKVSVWDGNLFNAEGENGRETHYQGVVRSRGPGVPYFYITRSGIADSDTGNMMVVRMGSRPVDGERLRSNRLGLNSKINETLPPSSDGVIGNYKFQYHHAGSITRVGDILAVALEKPKVTGVPKAKVMFFDASDPANPVPMSYSLDIESHDIGVVGLTKLSDGYFLCALTWDKNEKVEFYRSTRTHFGDPGFAFVLHDTWESSQLEDWPAGSGACYQDFSLLTQSDGRVFLIGSRRDSTAAPLLGKDLMGLYEISGWQGNTASTNVTLTLKVAEEQKWTDTPGSISNPVRAGTMDINADFLAGAGAYVSPTGQLYFYAVEHWNDGPGFTLRGVEFRPKEVAPAGSVLYGNRSNLRVNSFSLGEGDTLLLDASAASRGIKPWVELFEHDDYTGRSVIMDFDDRLKEDYQDFRKFGDGFNDEASAVRWYLPVGWSVILYTQDNFGTDESTYVLAGLGKTLSQSLKAANFNDRVTSMSFIPAANHTWNQGATVTWNSPGADPQVAALGATGTKIAQLFGGSKSGTFPVEITIGPAPAKTETYVFTVTNKPPQITRFDFTDGGAVTGRVGVVIGYRDDGINDTHSVSIEWGDGRVEAGIPVAHGSRLIDAAHVYEDNDPCLPDSSTYRIRVTLRDNDGGVVVQAKEHTVYWPRPLVNVRSRGNALVFENGTGLASVPHAPEFNSFPFTAMAWFRTTQTNSTALVSKYALNFGGYQIHLSGGHLYAWHFNGALGWVAGEGDRYSADGTSFIGLGLDGGFVADGEWHHVAWVVDQEGGKLYLDGVMRASRPWVGTAGFASQQLALSFGVWPGSRGPADRTRYVGELDEVSIWNTTLSQHQIDFSRYHLLDSNEPGLVAVFKMDAWNGLVVDGYRNGVARYQATVTTGVASAPSTVGRHERSIHGNEALVFTGNDGAIVTHADSLNLYPMTLTTWIRTLQTNSAAVINKYSDGSDTGFQLVLRGGRIGAVYYRSKVDYLRDGPGFIDGGFVADGQWHHLAFTVSERGGSVYVDGVLKREVGWTGFAGVMKGVTDLHFGRPALGASVPESYFVGQLDEVTLWNTAKVSSEIRELSFGPLTGNESGLIGYWPMDRPSDFAQRSRSPDLAALGGFNHAKASAFSEFVDSDVWAARSLRGPGNALRFDGQGGFAESSDREVLNPFPLTAMAWIKTSQTNEAALLNSYFVSSANGWQMFISEGRLRAWYFGDGLNYVYPGGNGLDGGWVADCQWHHVAFVVDESGGRLFVDGVEKASQPWFGSPRAPKSREPFRLGTYPGSELPTGSTYFGLMDEISVWNTALSGDAIWAYAHQQSEWDTPGLMAYWRCNEGTGNYAETFGALRYLTGLNLEEGVTWVDSDAPVGPPALVPIITEHFLNQDGKLTLRFSGQAGYWYRVQRMGRLESNTGWVDVGLATESAPGLFQYVEAGSPGQFDTGYFYRLLSQ